MPPRKRSKSRINKSSVKKNFKNGINFYTRMTILSPRVPTSTFWQSKHNFFLFFFFNFKNDCHDGPCCRVQNLWFVGSHAGTPTWESVNQQVHNKGVRVFCFFQAPSPPDLGILSLGCRVPGNLNTLKLPHVAGVIGKW